MQVAALVVMVASLAFAPGARATTHIEATQKTTNVFNSTAGEVTCETSKQTTQTTSSELSAIESSELKFEGCHIIVFGSTVSATVTTNGCNYKLYAAGTMDIVCPSGKQIEVKASGCAINIGPQTGLKSLSYVNNGSHVDASFNLGGIKYSHSGFLCGTGSGTNGTLKGEVTIEARDGGPGGTVINMDYVSATPAFTL